MKKLFVVFALALLPSLAEAASMTLSPASGSHIIGSTFSVAIYVNPAASEKIYTAKAEVSYPAAQLEVTGFSIASGWVPLTQAGYDSTDNTSGVMIKTGGYPSGVSSQTLLGTITFRAKASESASVNISGGSQTLDQNNANALTSRGSASFTLSAPSAPPPAPPPTPQPTPVPTPIPPKVTPAPKQSTERELAASTSTASTSTPVIAATVEETAGAQAAAAGALPEQTLPLTSAIALALVALAVGFGAGRFLPYKA